MSETKTTNWGGKRANSGRKKGTLNKGEHKTGRIVISCFEEEEKQIKQLAKEKGVTVSSLIISSVLGK